jgi:hypothetical protein
VLPREDVVAEIGVANGDYSAEILSLNRPAILHLLDPWEDKRYSEGLGYVRSRSAREIASGLVVLHHSRFIDVLPTLASKSLDWVYLDTTHT